MSLSSFYSNSVPSCSSPDSCLSKVRSSFSPESDSLNSVVSWEFDKYLFHLSKSWYFFSLSKKNLKSIYASCLSGSDFSSAVKNSNELKNNLILLFKEIEEANKLSLKIVSLLDASLIESDVNLMKDTSLFRVFSKLNNNLNQASHPSLSFDDSFYAVYLHRVSEFEKLFNLNNSFFISRDKISFFEFVENVFPAVRKKIPFHQFFVPALSDSVLNQIKLVSQKIILQDSLNLLEGVRVQEAIQAIDGFVSSENNSVAKKFVSLINESNQAFKNVNNQIKEKLGETESSLLYSRKLLEDSSVDFKGFDEIVLNELGESSSETIIASSSNDLIDLTNFKKIEEEKLRKLEAKLREFKLNKHTLGEKYSLIKQLSIDSKKIEDEITFFNNDEKNSLKFLCSNKIGKIKKTVYAFNEVNSLSPLVSELKFNIALFEKKQELKFCPGIIKKFVEFKQFENNLDEFVEKNFENTEACKKELKDLISYPELSDFEFSVNKVLLKENNYESLSECQALLESMKQAVFSTTEFIGFVKELNNFEKIINGFKQLPLTNTIEFDEKLEYYNDLKQNLVEFLKTKPLTNLKQDKESALKKLKQDLKKFVETNAEIELVSNQIINANQEFESITKISFYNPSISVDNIGFEFNLKPLKTELISCDSCELLREKNKIILFFSKLNLGNQLIKLKTIVPPIELNQVEKIVSINELKALIEKKISINNEQKINFFKIETSLNESNPSEISVLNKNQLIEFEQENQKISFTLINVKPREKIELFYSVYNPVKTSFELLKTIQKTDLVKEYEFKVKIENKLNKEINSIELNPTLALNNAIESIQTMNGENIVVANNNQRIKLKIKNLKPKEKKEFNLIIITNETTSFWSNKFEELFEKTSLMNQTSELKSLIKKLELLENNFSPTKNKITEFNKIEEKIRELEQVEKNKDSKETEYNRLRFKAEEMLSTELNKNYLTEEKFVELRKLLEQADEAKKNNEIDLALTLIKSFSSKITEAPLKISEEFFTSEVEKIMGEVKKTTIKARELGLSKRISKTKNEILELNQELNSFLIQGKTNTAEKTLNTLREKQEQLKQELENETINKLKTVKEKTMKKLVKTSELNEKIIELKKQLLAFDKVKKLVDYAPPTTIKRIKTIEEELKKINLKKTSEEMKEINNLEKTNPSLALKKLIEFNEKHYTDLEKINSFYTEIDTALNKIIQDSTTYYNLAGKHVKPTELKKIKQAIQEKNYVKAIALAKTAMVSMNNTSNINLKQFPIAIIPFILIILGVIIYKYKQKQEQKKPKKKRKINEIK